MTLENVRGWLVCESELPLEDVLSQGEMEATSDSAHEDGEELLAGKADALRRCGCLTSCSSVVERKPRHDSVSQESVWTSLGTDSKRFFVFGGDLGFLKNIFFEYYKRSKLRVKNLTWTTLWK